jgi:hypothetical protein
MSARGVTVGDFTWPGARHVRWRPSEEDDSLPWVRFPDLLVEFERFRRGVSANVEHDEILDIGLPKKSSSGDLFSLMHLYCVSSQDGGARLAHSPKAVDEENFFSGKSRVATKWRWAIHTTPPKRARVC